MAQNINRVVVTGNLTRDPELRSSEGGTSVCTLRVACNGRKRNGEGEWEDKPNFFDVVVFGAQAENAATYLEKGRGVAVDGRLDWQQWQAEDGTKRQAVKVVAQSVQFLGSRGAGSGSARPAGEASAATEPAVDDDIPF